MLTEFYSLTMLSQRVHSSDEEKSIVIHTMGT